MNRSHLYVAAALTLGFTVPAAAPAQCAKQVVAYLDGSGSMRPTSRDASSPYYQVVDALNRLMLKPKLIAAGDELHFLRFGEEVQLSGDRQDDLQRLHSRDSAGGVNFRYTNLAAAFSDMSGLLTSKASFKHRLAVVASDFAHDPRRAAGDVRLRLEDWARIAPEIHQTIARLFPAGGGSSLVLLVAPAVEARDLAVREKILADLKALQGADLQVYNLGSAEASPDQVASKLLSSLLLDVAVDVTGATPGQAGAVVLSNPNCIDLTLTNVAVSCSSGPGQRSSMDITPPPEMRRLAPGPATTLAVPAAALANCGQSAPDLLATVTTQERGQQPGARADLSRLKIAFEPEKVISEWNLLHQRLHVFLNLKGYVPPNHHFVLSVLDHDRPLASGRLLPKDSLPVTDPHMYRADLNAGILPLWNPTWDLKLKVDDAGEPAAKPVKFDSWAGQTVLNLVMMVLVVVAGAAILIRSTTARSRRGGAPAEPDALLRLAKWVPLVGLCTLPFVIQWVLPTTYLFRPMSFVTLWLVASAALGLFAGQLRAAAMASSQSRRSLRSALRNGELTLATLRARVTEVRRIAEKRRSAAAWGLAVAALAFLLGLGMLRSGPLVLPQEYQSAEILTTLSD